MLVNDLMYTTRNVLSPPALFEHRPTHTSLLLSLPASALRDDLLPEDPNLSSNLPCASLRGNGPQERSHLERTAETVGAEARLLPGVEKTALHPHKTTRAEGQSEATAPRARTILPLRH